ncbi:hypothetical protein N9N13_04355 [Opitutales bacterium]|nr:hypothetical protein [Opitutales bacterium]
MKIYTSSILSILLFSCFGSFLHGQPTTYSNTASYIVGDLVVSGSATYIAIAGSTGQTPPNTSYWSDLSVAATALNIPTEAVPTLDTQTILNSLPGFTPDGGASSGVSIYQKGLSTAGYVSSDAYLSGGFIIKGGTKRVIIMGKGAGNVSDPLDNPRLDLLSGNSNWSSIANNSDWKSGSQVTDITATKLMNGYKDTDAALITTLEPGTYLANVHSQSGDAGGALVEIYDLDAIEGTSSNSYLHAISTNGTVLAGTAAGQKMSAGFDISGTGSLKVLIMAKTSVGVTSDPLNNPRLDLLSGNASWASIANNSDWKNGSNVTEITATKLMNGYPDNSAALMLTLQPGVYIADVYSEDSDSGGALVEVYLVED